MSIPPMRSGDSPTASALDVRQKALLCALVAAYLERLNRSSLLFCVHQNMLLTSPAEQSPSILRLAAKREILSPKGICAYLGDVHRSIVEQCPPPEYRLDDPAYQELVQQIIAKSNQYAPMLRESSMAEVLSFIQVSTLTTACSQVLEEEGYESESEEPLSVEEDSYESESDEYPLEECVCECEFCTDMRATEKQFESWVPQSNLERIMYNSVNL